ncbi:small multi-drug export protein [Virgibacillus alimentarius]|uniref:Membrane protein n=1 Tax=Virgibacillus alimentarius TaxID=698769 RepID=A0ABS4S9N9_9BACI|nr:small multi-drug export protein [Virgibacillus alimentarius]MBP2257806.1 putative membrane protein [Virgibacillus alimentarius]
MLEELIQKITDLPSFYQVLMIFVIGFVPFLESHVAVPLGVIVDLPFVPITLVAIVANFISVMFLIVFASFLRTNMFKKKGTSVLASRINKAQYYFNRYGVPGLSLMGPIIGANHISAFVSMMAGATRRQVIIWQFISITAWGIGTGILLIYGIDVYNLLKE